MRDNAHPIVRERASRGIARASLFLLLAQIATASFTAVLTLYLVRALGPRAYGVFALAVSIGGLVLLPADFGISASAARFVADEHSDPDAVADVVSHALRLKLLVSTTICAALFVLAGLIARAYHAAGLAWPLRAVALAIFGQGLMMLLGGTFVALRRTSFYLAVVLGESAVETGASIALVLLAGGATAAAFGRAAGYLCGSALGVVILRRSVSRDVTNLGRRTAGRLREVARYAGALVLIDTSLTVFNEVDVLLIGALLSSSAVGLFSAPMRLVTFLCYPAYALAVGVAPRVGANAKDRVSAGTFELAWRYGTLFQAGLVAPTMVWAHPIVNLLFTSKFSAAAPVLRVLGPLVLLMPTGALTSMSVNYLGHARRRVPIAIGTAVLNASIDLVLLPRVGVIGGAIGTDVAYTLYVVGHVWICTKALDLNVGLVCRTLLRTATAASAMAGVMALFGTTTLTAAQWLGGGVAGGLMYMAILIITREVTRADLMIGRDMFESWRHPTR